MTLMTLWVIVVALCLFVVAGLLYLVSEKSTLNFRPQAKRPSPIPADAARGGQQRRAESSHVVSFQRPAAKGFERRMRDVPKGGAA